MNTKPIIKEVDTYEDRSHFVIQNVDVCVVNSLRRVLLSNIPVLVFRGFPNNRNNIHISKNTSKFNNEYLKHRLSCLPIVNSNPSSFKSFVENYVMVLKKSNDTSEKLHVTTEDIKIKNKNTDAYLSSEEVQKYFPPDPLTGDYILIATLYPNFNKKNEPNEEIDLEAEFDIGTADENSGWNVVHNATYEFVQDYETIQKRANEIKDPYEKKDFLILDAQRFYIPNEYKMTIQSIGIFSNQELIDMATKIMIKKLSKVAEYMNAQSPILTKNEFDFRNTNGMLSVDELDEIKNKYCEIYLDDDFYVFKIFKDDFTVGKLIEKYLYYLYGKEFEFIGFKKEHPTKKDAFIYMKFKNNKVSNTQIYEYFTNIINVLIDIYNTIQTIKV